MPSHTIPANPPQNSCTINVTQIADSYLKYSDMTNVDADLPIEGLLTPQESVEKMLAVILGKTIDDTGTFWTWEGKVSTEPFHLYWQVLLFSIFLPSSASRRSYGLFNLYC